MKEYIFLSKAYFEKVEKDQLTIVVRKKRLFSELCLVLLYAKSRWLIFFRFDILGKT